MQLVHWCGDVLDNERGWAYVGYMTLNEHIERGIAAFGIVGTLAFGAWAGQAIAHADAPRDDSSYDYSQSAFPCQEDEVLGYAPQFGPDHVGCIHVEGNVLDDDIGWDAGYEG